MHIIFIILIGFVVGLVARWIGPGGHIQGFWITVLIGIAGSVIATYGGQALGLYRVGRPASSVRSSVRSRCWRWSSCSGGSPAASMERATPVALMILMRHWSGALQ